jgi:3',5'-cyclic AMP phosphodiesterase CpdA
VAPAGVAPLLGKRGLGWLSWQLRRRRAHRPEVLEALLRDLEESRPDHVVVTGDLTNVSLEEEFVAARGWLARLGSPDRVTAVPGNHDAYVRVAEARSLALWSEYLVSDAGGRELLLEACALEKTAAIEFPSVRLLAGVALVGLCSALPTPAFQASGELGETQLARLEGVLAELGARGYLRVVLIHHPPAPGSVSARRALRDADALCAVLRRCGAELVLHGHLHRTRVGSLPGPAQPIPVVGGRSASHAIGHPDRLARYHLLGIDGGPATPRIVLREREYDPEAGAFREVGAPDGLVLSHTTSSQIR